MAPRRKLGEILVSEGLIDEIQLRSAIGHQKNWGGKLGSALIELGFITEDALAKVLEGQLKLNCLQTDRLIPDPQALKAMTMQDALRFMVLPLRVEGHEMIVAMSNPFDLAVTDELSFKLNKKVRGLLAVESSIRKAIKKYYGGGYTGKEYKVDLKEVKGAPAEIIHHPQRREEAASRVVEPSPEPKSAEVRPEMKRETKKVEPSGDMIAKAVAYLLIEKGIIKREELVEKMKSIKEKG